MIHEDNLTRGLKQKREFLTNILVAVILIIGMNLDPSDALASPSAYSEANKKYKDFEGVKEPNFHQILQRLGKTCLRPGGGTATKTLVQWSKLTSNDHILELSAGLGKTGMLFAREVGCKVTITDTDKHRMDLVKKELNKNPTLKSLVTPLEMDMFHIDDILGATKQFDAIITEASITHYSLEKKQEIFRKIASHTNHFLLHEICFMTDDTVVNSNVCRDMRKVLKIGFFPETKDKWIALLQEAGFENIEECQVGEIGILKPMTLLEDEGIIGLMGIAKNLASNEYLRSRVLATRSALSDHKHNLGYVIISAKRGNVN